MKYEEFSPKCQAAIEKARKIVDACHKEINLNKPFAFRNIATGIILGEGITLKEAQQAGLFLYNLADLKDKTA